MKKRRSILGAVLLAAAVGFPAVAQARVVDLRLGGNAGGMYGWGTTQGTPDFFAQAKGAGFGFEAGLKLLIFDVSVDFMQMVNDAGLKGTLIQLLAGTDVDIPAGQSKLSNGQNANIVHIGAEAGFGLGTSAPVTPPIMNEELADKGFVSRFRLGYEYFLNPIMGVGVQGDFGYHYFLGGHPINVPADHSAGYHLIGLAMLTFHFGI
jgi:hypothetical protein